MHNFYYFPYHKFNITFLYKLTIFIAILEIFSKIDKYLNLLILYMFILCLFILHLSILIII